MAERGGDRSNDVGSSPSSATAIRAIALALFEAGYDGRDPDAMHELAEDLRVWRQRRRAAKRRVGLWTILWTALATGVLGVIIPWFLQWVTSLLSRGHSGAPPPGAGD